MKMKNNNSDILKKLEEIYKVKFSLEERQRDIPRYLQMKNDQIEELKQSLTEMENKFEEYIKGDFTLKLEIQDINIKKSKAEEKIDSIKTQREYEALEKELELIVNEEVAIRKKVGHITNLKTKLEREISDLKIKLKEEQDDYEIQNFKLKEELQDIDLKLKDTLEKKVMYSSKMNEDFLFKFERIIQNKSNGVVPLIDNVCRGCYMILPLEFANKVRKESDEIKFCPYCSRILYYQEKLDSNNDIVPGSLADLIE